MWEIWLLETFLWSNVEAKLILMAIWFTFVIKLLHIRYFGCSISANRKKEKKHSYILQEAIPNLIYGSSHIGENFSSINLFVKGKVSIFKTKFIVSSEKEYGKGWCKCQRCTFWIHFCAIILQEQGSTAEINSLNIQVLKESDVEDLKNINGDTEYLTIYGWYANSNKLH